MAMTLTPMTELQAVNIMFATAGIAPVSDLLDTDRVDLTVAQSILEEVTRDTLEKGWDFNTDENYEVAIDGDGKIPVPSDALSIDPVDKSRQYVVRGGFMWDKKNHTAVINENVKFDIVRFFDYSTLPQAARRYIAISAARIFQKRMMGDQTVDVYTAEQEATAWVALLQAHGNTSDLTLLDDPVMYRTLRTFHQE